MEIKQRIIPPSHHSTHKNTWTVHYTSALLKFYFFLYHFVVFKAISGRCSVLNPGLVWRWCYVISIPKGHWCPCKAMVRTVITVSCIITLSLCISTRAMETLWTLAVLTFYLVYIYFFTESKPRRTLRIKCTDMLIHPHPSCLPLGPCSACFVLLSVWHVCSIIYSTCMKY